MHATTLWLYGARDGTQDSRHARQASTLTTKVYPTHYFWTVYSVLEVNMYIFREYHAVLITIALSCSLKSGCIINFFFWLMSALAIFVVVIIP